MEKKKLVGVVEGKGLGKLVASLKGQGLSYRDVSREIFETTGQRVSHAAVKTYCDKFLSVLPKDKPGKVGELREELVAREFLFCELDKLRREAWKYLEWVKSVSTKPDSNFASMLRELREQLVLIARISGEYREGQRVSVKADSVTMNVVDFAGRAGEYVENLRRSGGLVCGDCGSKNVRLKRDG